MQNKSLKFKILLGVMLSCLTIFATGAFIYKSIFNIRSLQKQQSELETIVLDVKKLQFQITDMESGIRAYLITGRSEDLEPFSKTEGLFDTQLKKTKETIGESEISIQDKLDKILGIKVKWLESSAVGEMLGRRKLEAGIIDQKEFAKIVINSEGNILIRDLKTEVSQIVSEYEGKMAVIKGEVDHLMSGILTIVLIGTLLTIFISFAIQYVITISASRSFTDIIKTLVETSKRLSEVSKNSKKGSRSLRQQVDVLNCGLETNASTLEEIGSMIQRTSDNSKEAIGLVNNTNDRTKDGISVLHNLEQSISEISDSNNDIEKTISQKFSEIENSLEMVERIADNTRLINDIVFQTKLLSFNASVEAARAGEHGKGFSVVAEEIGNLAKVSGDSADKIESIIQLAKKELSSIIEESIGETTSLFENNQKKLDRGKDTLKECSDNFENVKDSVEDVAKNFREISMANQEQATGVHQLTQSAGEFEVTSKTCLKVADETSFSMEKLEEDTQNIADQVQKISTVIFGEKKENDSSHFEKIKELISKKKVIESSDDDEIAA